MRPIRIGLLGTNVLGRQLYWLAQQNSGFEVVALADAGDPAIVAQLLNRAPGAGESRLEGDEFIAGDMITRLVCRMTGFEVLWEAFDVDVVIDAAGRSRTRVRCASSSTPAHRVCSFRACRQPPDAAKRLIALCSQD